MTPPSGTVQHYTSYVRRPLSVWSRNRNGVEEEM